MNTGRLFVLGIVSAMIVLLLVLAPDNKNQIDDIKPYVQSVAIKDEMELCTDAELKRDFGISASQTDGFLLFETADRSDTRLILVLKVKEQNEADRFRRDIQKKIRADIKDLPESRSKSRELLKNAKIITKGKFLFVIISEDNREIIRILRSAVR